MECKPKIIIERELWYDHSNQPEFQVEDYSWLWSKHTVTSDQNISQVTKT